MTLSCPTCSTPLLIAHEREVCCLTTCPDYGTHPTSPPRRFMSGDGEAAAPAAAARTAGQPAAERPAYAGGGHLHHDPQGSYLTDIARDVGALSASSPRRGRGAGAC